MSNFELIDDYLSSRLQGGDKVAFEKQLENDPTLRSDLDFQKQVVEGIRSARALELKNMLSKVPVGGTGVTIDFAPMKMAAGIIGAGIIGGALYFYVTRGELPPFDKAAANITKQADKATNHKSEQTPETKTPGPNTPENNTPVVKEDESKQKPVRKQNQDETKALEKPVLDVTDPSEDLNSNDNTKKDQPIGSRATELTPSNIQVEMDSSNKKYDFHYQFVGSKLMLYGSFDRSLYEVLEINGENHALFLFYKDAYYLLDEKQTKIARLEPIKDAALVGKLREYRKK